MSRRVPFPFKVPVQPTFGESQVRITIEIDQNGLMKTEINKPLPAVQIIGLLLDCMQGQYQAMAQQASLLINPNAKPVRSDIPITQEMLDDANAGKEKENNDDRRRDSSGGEPRTG